MTGGGVLYPPGGYGKLICVLLEDYYGDVPIMIDEGQDEITDKCIDVSWDHIKHFPCHYQDTDTISAMRTRKGSWDLFGYYLYVDDPLLERALWYRVVKTRYQKKPYEYFRQRNPNIPLSDEVLDFYLKEAPCFLLPYYFGWMNNKYNRPLLGSIEENAWIIFEEALSPRMDYSPKWFKGKPLHTSVYMNPDIKIINITEAIRSIDGLERALNIKVSDYNIKAVNDIITNGNKFIDEFIAFYDNWMKTNDKV